MVKAVVGVKGFYFSASHYTLGAESKCRNLHGHTYRVDVEVCGDVDESTGMVVDFLILKRVVEEVLRDYDHKLLIPRRDLESVSIRGPFSVEVKVLEYPHATAEYLALDIARRVREKIGLPVRVKLYEGHRNYVVIALGEFTGCS